MFSRKSKKIAEALAGIFELGLPKQRWVTHKELSEMTRDQLSNMRSEVAEATKQLKPLGLDVVALQFMVGDLADAKYEPAIPLLIRIWEECPLFPVRQAAGNALLGFGTPECLDALIETINYEDWLNNSSAVAAVFMKHKKQAFDELAHYFAPEHLNETGGHVVPALIVQEFIPYTVTESERSLDNSDFGYLVIEDPRWLDLLIPLKDHREIGWSIKRLLRLIDDDFLEQAMATIEAPSPLPRLIKKGDYLSRYLNGEHKEVWNEIRTFGSLSEDACAEVKEVADEVMQRVKQNVVLLGGRLESLGWVPFSGQFAGVDDGQQHRKISEKLDGSIVGPLPPVLVSFWETIQQVDFVWNYRQSPAPKICSEVDLRFEEFDPLCINGANTSMLDELNDWREENQNRRAELQDPFFLSLAPDRLHKMDVSGGGPYGIELPFSGAEPRFDMFRKKPFLIDYLRQSLYFGGFAGLQHEQLSVPAVEAFLVFLTSDFVPF